jgi:hypothetical protein
MPPVKGSTVALVRSGGGAGSAQEPARLKIKEDRSKKTKEDNSVTMPGGHGQAADAGAAMPCPTSRGEVTRAGASRRLRRFVVRQNLGRHQYGPVLSCGQSAS